jgi:hypothetical protein
MSQADESRLETRVGIRHQDGRPYHFASLNQDERIRRVFGLSEETPLPSVNDQNLAVYYDHLVANLSLPFDALYCPTGGDVRQLIHYVRVIELTDPRQGPMHNLHGLFCRAQNAKQVLDLSLADLGVRDENPNCQLIDDYAYWFVNWR